jgi:two-component system NtrC family response regulator
METKEDNLSILVVDDEVNQREMLGGFLKKEGHTVFMAPGGREALELLNTRRFDVVLTDIRMPQMDGMALLKAVKSQQPETAVVMITAFGSVETAVSAMREGAYDYLTKPVDLDELTLLLARIGRSLQLERENQSLREERAYQTGSPEDMVVEDPPMAKVWNLIRQVAESEATVLITGESGTGKELIARSIHAYGPRKDRPFVAINCAAIPETLLESELFGHEKGAFTGAIRSHRGKFEQAQGGTLFLDEVGDLPLSLQPKLLRVLQDHRVERVGGERTYELDVRILAATHRDLGLMIQDGQFREDFYYRLNVIHLPLPPLRERPEALPLLAEFFLKKYRMKYGKPKMGMRPETLALLKKYPFPGNVRELETMMERAVVLGRGADIGPEDLPFPVEKTTPNQEDLMALPAPEGQTLPAALETVEKTMIAQAMTAAGGVQTRAAELLGISERMLRYKLKKYGSLL